MVCCLKYIVTYRKQKTKYYAKWKIPKLKVCVYVNIYKNAGMLEGCV